MSKARRQQSKTKIRVSYSVPGEFDVNEVMAIQNPGDVGRVIQKSLDHIGTTSGATVMLSYDFENKTPLAAYSFVCFKIFKDGHPSVGTTVLVDGGLAMWDGQFWICMTGDDSRRPLAWKPTWWAHIPILPPSTKA